MFLLSHFLSFFFHLNITNPKHCKENKLKTLTNISNKTATQNKTTHLERKKTILTLPGLSKKESFVLILSNCNRFKNI